MDQFIQHIRQAKSLMPRFPKLDWHSRVNGLIEHWSNRVAGTEDERATARLKMRRIAARELRMPELLDEETA